LLADGGTSGSSAFLGFLDAGAVGLYGFSVFSACSGLEVEVDAGAAENENERDASQ